MIFLHRTIFIALPSLADNHHPNDIISDVDKWASKRPTPNCLYETSKGHIGIRLTRPTRHFIHRNIFSRGPGVSARSVEDDILLINSLPVFGYILNSTSGKGHQTHLWDIASKKVYIIEGLLTRDNTELPFEAVPLDEYLGCNRKANPTVAMTDATSSMMETNVTSSEATPVPESGINWPLVIILLLIIFASIGATVYMCTIKKWPGPKGQASKLPARKGKASKKSPYMAATSKHTSPSTLGTNTATGGTSTKGTTPPPSNTLQSVTPSKMFTADSAIGASSKKNKK